MAVPQPVSAPLTRAAIFLVVTINPGPDQSRGRSIVLRRPSGIVPRRGISRPRGRSHLRDGDRLRRMGPPVRTPAAGRAAPVPGDSGRIAPCGIVARRSAVPYPREADGSLLRTGDAGSWRASVTRSQRSTRFMDFVTSTTATSSGFVDGTENPAGQAVIEAAIIGEEDAAFAGGSYVIVQKYLHDMDGWNALSTEAQERIIGRTKLSDIELDNSIKPTSAHNALTTITENGREFKILRDNMPFGSAAAGEFGTYFIGYCRTPRVTEQMIENMFVGRPPGNYDRLLDFSRAVTGTLFFVPSASFLESVNDDDADAATPAATSVVEPAPSTAPCPMVRSASAPSKEKTGMNNLHRELAPISDAAWADIEEETTRTLKRYLAGRRVVDVHGPGGVGLSAVGTGHLKTIAAPGEGILARQRDVKALVEFRVPFELDRQQIDDVERGRKRFRLATCEGRRAEDRLCRGPRHLRGLRRGGHRRHPAGHQQSDHDAPGRRAPVSRRHRASVEPAASRRCQRPLFGAARRRCLYGPRRDQRQRVSRAGACQKARQRRDHLGPGHQPGPSCSPPVAAISTCTSARTSRSVI